MRRRKFITLLGGAAVWPLAARAQQPERMRRIGVLMNTAFDDPEGQARVAALMQGLQEWGWAVGRNVRVDLRWGAGDAQRLRVYADELVALGPDVLLASGLTTVAPLLQVTRTVPMVFVNVTDPVGSTIVESLARPGGNVTGFANFEFGISAKWIELLKELSPRLSRVGVLRDPVNPAVMGLLGSIQSVAPSFGVELQPIAVRGPSEIERAFATFVQTSIGGVIVLTGGAALVHRGSIISWAAKHRLPAVYPFRYHVLDGGLISYGPNSVENYRRAASYLDRILKGEKPADLPVQAPTKYELVINLKTAKALGLDLPATVLARADEVIE
jgi:putative ABC transport system substrate-binding protein